MLEAGGIGGGDVLQVDVVIVGAGVAGLVAALDLVDAQPSLRVAIVDKGEPGSSGSTPLAQGGMAAAVGPDDSPALHAADTVRAGDGLCDERAVGVMAAEGPARIGDLVRRGALFDRHDDGTWSLAREGGQSVARSVKAADATGAEIFRALRAAARARVRRVQGVAAELALRPGPERRASGVWVLLDEVGESALGPAQAAGLALVSAPTVVLATGGCGGLYGSTTNPDGATGDGVALAWRAGAALVDMEFVQFHPTGLKVPAAAGGAAGSGGSHWRLLLTEALRGAGATLVDADGQRFMPQRHPDAELAPRHVVAKAILDQPDGAWLDCTGIAPEILAEEFPTVVAGARRYGLDLASAPVPVEPCQHYLIGGVATDLYGRTSVPGLWAAGETANTGVHGANRMAGNSLLQSCVFASRVAASIGRTLGDTRAAGPDVPVPRLADASPVGVDLPALRSRLRAAMSDGAGPVRSAASLEGLRVALDEIDEALGETPASDRDHLELRNGVDVARLVAASAALRTESRGVHWRSDMAATDPAWEGVRLRTQRSR